jgi:hypothetical protein
MAIVLYAAAFLTLGIAVAHSYLGERYLLIRLFRRNDLPKLFGSSEFTVRTLRFAWHITSLAWLGFAAVFVMLANPPLRPQTLCAVLGGVFILHGIIALGGSKGRHLSWIVFLTIGFLALFAALQIDT